MDNLCLEKPVGKIDSLLFNAALDMTVIGRGFVFVVIIPVANQVGLGVILICEIVLRIAVADRTAIRIADPKEVPPIVAVGDSLVFWILDPVDAPLVVVMECEGLSKVGGNLAEPACLIGEREPVSIEIANFREFPLWTEPVGEIFLLAAKQILTSALHLFESVFDSGFPGKTDIIRRVRCFPNLCKIEASTIPIPDDEPPCWFALRGYVFQPDIVGIPAYTEEIFDAAIIAERVKEVSPGTTVLVGGPHPSAIPEETLNEFGSFDIAVVGEGESALLDIALNKPLEMIPGIAAPPCMAPLPFERLQGQGIILRLC